MAGPFLQLTNELGSAIRGAWKTTVNWPLSNLASGNSPVADQDVRPLAGFYRLFLAVVLEPLYLRVPQEVGPRYGICFGTECLLP